MSTLIVAGTLRGCGAAMAMVVNVLVKLVSRIAVACMAPAALAIAGAVSTGAAGISERLKRTSMSGGVRAGAGDLPGNPIGQRLQSPILHSKYGLEILLTVSFGRSSSAFCFGSEGVNSTSTLM